MAEKPAPLDVVRQKLDARNAEARIVALRHAAAHGAAARDLAAKVAAMLEDESAAVQWQAVGTLRSIAAGATDAVPVLLGLRAKGTPPMLISRATCCLGFVGPAARDAVPVLKAALLQAPDDQDVLEALWDIVPDDPEVLDTVLAGAFSSTFGRYLAASRLLKNAKDPVIDRVFAEIALRTEAADADSCKAAARLLMNVASKRPKSATDLLRELLRDPGAAHVRHAASAVRELPAPRPIDLVDAVARVAAGDDVAATRRALEVLVDLGAEASTAQDTFLKVIARNLGADPVAGEAGWPANALSAAAAGLAQACPTDRAVEPLLSWLCRVAAPRKAARRELSWYPMGRVVEALARLAPTSTAVHEAILSAVAMAQRCIDDDESGVLDFHRSVRRAFEHLSNREEMLSKAEQLGMPRVDPYAADNGPEDADSSFALPDFPADDEAQPTATLAPLDEAERQEIAVLAAAGRDLLGVGQIADPPTVAGAVDRWLRRLKRERASAADEDRNAIAVAYGDAVARITGWEWSRYLRQGRHYLALASPDAGCVHLPLDFMSRQIVPGKDVTALLLFNMLADGEWPDDARAGELRVVG